ncbi:TrkA family potassium uptake protein [Flavobacterium sp. CS20]|uniref:potassium channel family protein n=1 Tax=Flavobacterium sp. CS20 TaxID=2775246 RepID=UPI001B39E60B|nr:potassium channel protein [Flavobacterium sp. CS20]QTY27171.1 potassium channel protein [Flavobacterium sp. CS20]
MKSLRFKIILAMALMIIILLAGVIGFKNVMDLSWIDAFYMTAITITTVGYREVVLPNDDAKVFIIILILSSVIILGFVVSVATEYFISFSSLSDLQLKRKLKKIKKMENHTIVCGFGRNGQQAAQKLMEYQDAFLVIDKNLDLLEQSGLKSEQFLVGNANEDEVLISAGIEKAANLITALPNDAENLFIVLSARQLNKDLRIISRASEETSYRKLKLAGADNVILPDKIGGQHMASLIVSPDLLEFWDNLSYGDSKSVNLEQVSYEQLFSHGKSCTILELDLRQRTGCTIIGFKSSDGEYIVNPNPNIKLTPNSKIIVIGNASQIKRLQEIYSI